MNLSPKQKTEERISKISSNEMKQSYRHKKEVNYLNRSRITEVYIIEVYVKMDLMVYNS
jgi:hypothetical protein